MRNVRAALIGAVMVAGLMGCRNKVAEENAALWQQNREQQAEMDRTNAEMEAERRLTQAAVAPPPLAQAPTPAPQPPEPQPAPEPRSLEGIPDTETDRDVAAGTITVNLPGDIFFDPGAATIKSAARASLGKVAAALQKDYAGKDVRIEGHTDSDPIRRSKWKSNQQLSEARAKSVRDYLVKQGVDASTVSTIGHGADSPRGQDKAKNRRVEVVVLVDADAPSAQPSPVPAPTPAFDEEPAQPSRAPAPALDDEPEQNK